MRRSRKAVSAAITDYLPAHDRWLLSYADFVTLLLAVFIVLLASVWHRTPPPGTASTAIHPVAELANLTSAETVSSQTLPNPQHAALADKPPVPQIDTAALKRELHDVLGQAIDRNEIVLQQTPDGLVISLRELGFFNSGEATLLPGAAEKLRSAAAVLMRHGLDIRVEGHSDDQPIHTDAYESNWQLSTARAMSVLQLLLDGTGLPPEQVSVAGYGPYHPVADNSTAEGRRMNRRVDLVVVAPRSSERGLP